MKQVFITGATGFVGGHTLDSLVKATEYRITALSRRKRNGVDGVSFIEGDIGNASLIDDVIKNVDFVIHMAGCKHDTGLLFQTNVTGTKNIVDACRRHGYLEKLIYLSSVGVIGDSGDVVINENTTCSPDNNYEESKYRAELIVKEYSQQNPGKVVILRPTNVFGEKDPEQHLLNLIKKITQHRFCFVGKGISNYYLNYLYVKEIAELISKLLSFRATSDLYIINTPTRLSEFIMVIKEILKDDIPIRHLPYLPVRLVAMCSDLLPERMRKYSPINSLKLAELTNRKKYSSALLVEDFNWQPCYETEDALRNLISYYNQEKMLV